MSFQYQETTQDLKTRIDIHQRYGSRNIDEWMLDLLKPAEGARILDVGCGSGKQLSAFHKHSNGKAQITGGDVNPSLLEEARARNAELGNPWKLVALDFDRPFEFGSGSYDLVTCCFALYYAKDFGFTVGEMHRVLAPGGRLLIVDFAPHDLESLRDEHAHRRLGFADADISAWLKRAGLVPKDKARLPGDPLTVVVWTADKERQGA